MSKGYDFQSATMSAYNMIARTLNGQATFLTYEDLFFGPGLFFLVMIPLLVMFKD